MFKVTVLSNTGFNEKQLRKMNSAVEKFERVMNSDELKYKIINFTCELGERFESNMGLTNEQIFKKLYAGEETYIPGSNNTADLYLVLKNKWKIPFSSDQPIGYGMPSDKEICTYSWWFNRADDYEYAGHLAHEWSHKLGFIHSAELTPTRDCSVPYAFGHIVEMLAKALS